MTGSQYNIPKRGKDLTALRFKRLLVVKYLGRSRHGAALWECLCDCGRTVAVTAYHLTVGKTGSCGCLSRDLTAERGTSHGKSHDPIYKIWDAMIARCHRPKDKAYKNYGGRGIFVCDRWHAFENFYADMGDAPDSLTLERRDNDKGYDPENCYWASRLVQLRNTRRNHYITIEGVSKCVSEWAKENGLKVSTAFYRLSKEWDPIDAVTIPAKPKSR